MVRTRLSTTANGFKNAMSALVDKFGKDMTHRLKNNTYDVEGRIVSITETNAVFFGDLQYGTEVSLKLISAGFIKAGEGLLYVSATDSEMNNIMADKSIIIEGTVAGTYNAWNVVEEIMTDQIGGDSVFKTFRLTKRTRETIS